MTSEVDIGSGEFRVNDKNALQFFGRERYQNRLAALTELIANEVTACLRARDEHGANLSEMQITLEHRGGEIVIHGDGIGITKQTFENNIVESANSPNKSDYHGRYGIGQKSAKMLGDTYEVHTFSRETGERFAFRVNEDNTYEQVECEREHFGTDVVIPLREEARKIEIENHLRKITKFIPVDVSYIHGNHVEKFDGQTYEDHYDDENAVKVEGDGFTAFFSKNANGYFYVGRMPVEKKKVLDFYHYAQDIDVHIHRNDGYITNGPNAGKRVVDSTPEEGEILRKNLNEHDVVIPQTTSDRERIKDEDFDKFSDHIVQQLVKEISSCVEDIVGGFTYFPGQVPRSHRRLLVDSGNIDELDISDEKKVLLNHVSEIVQVYRGSGNPERVSSLQDRSLWNYVEDINSSTTVYVGKTLNNRRVEIAEELHPGCSIIRFGGRQSNLTYDVLKSLGFKVLKDEISLDREDFEDEIDSDRLDEIFGADGVEENEITLHSGTGTMKVKIADIEERIGQDNWVVLFPRHTKPNLSDNKKDVVSDHIRGAVVDSEEMDWILENVDNAVSFEDRYPLTEPDFDLPDGKVSIFFTPEGVDFETVVRFTEINRYRGVRGEAVDASELDIEYTIEFVNYFDRNNDLHLCYVECPDSKIFSDEKSVYRRHYSGLGESFEHFKQFSDRVDDDDLLRGIINTDGDVLDWVINEFVEKN